MTRLDDRGPVRADGVTRRGAGIALLALVVMLFGVVAAVRGRVVPGEPTAQPVPAPPQVGDCILENPHALGADLFPFATPLAALRSGACVGSRFGEVVSVGAGHPDGVDAPMAAIEQCFRETFAYLGLPTPPPLTDLPTGPAVMIPSVIVGPDDRQRASGQDWTACVVFLPVSTDLNAPITTDHSLRGAWDRPDDSRLFSWCLVEVEDLASTECARPHRFEAISFRPGDPTASPESVKEACAKDVTEAIGSSAGLDRGEISFIVVPVRPKPDGLIIGPDAVTNDTGYRNICLVSPSDPARMLTGSVRGLFDAPLPLN